MAQMSNWWEQSFLIWELQSKTISQITLLGRVQPPFRTLLTVRFLVVLAPIYNSSRESLITFSFLIFYCFAVSKIRHRESHFYQVRAIAQMSNWWKRPFLIWELYSKSLPQITLLGSVQPPFTTLLTVRLLVAVVPLSNSSGKSLRTFSFLTFYSYAVLEIQHRQ